MLANRLAGMCAYLPCGMKRPGMRSHTREIV
jgi:hypothetical protein